MSTQQKLQQSFQQMSESTSTTTHPQKQAAQYQGSCLCGEIRYEICGEIGPLIYCHCQRCRKANGTAFASNAPVKVSEFHIVQGEHLLKKFHSTPSTIRCFCSQCASPIISIKADTPEFYRLRVGTLDTPLKQHPTQHFYVDYKAEWETITDDLPQFSERP